jgi:hypothetical protein
VIVPQLDSKDDVVEIDEHVALSRNGQWLFVLTDAKKQQQQQQCFWFQIESEAKEMEAEMQRVIEQKQREQVRQHYTTLIFTTQRSPH